MVINAHTGEKFQSQHRIGKTSQHNTTAHPIFKTLNQRVADMTELNTDFASVWNVNTYDVGGRFREHHDYTLNSDIFQGRGPRIASLLLYVCNLYSSYS